MALIDRERLVSIGQVLEPHGLAGELKVLPLTDAPAYYEAHCRAVLLETPGGLRRYEVRVLRRAGNRWRMALAGVESRAAAEPLAGAPVLLEREQLKPLEPGEYLVDDLVGCTVRTRGGETVGRVDGIMETGANDVLVVRTAQGAPASEAEVLIPRTPEVVVAVDLTAGEITIDPLPGMLEPDADEA